MNDTPIRPEPEWVLFFILEESIICANMKHDRMKNESLLTY